MHLKLSCLALVFLAVGSAFAQSTSNVSAYGGSVSGQVGSDPYQGMGGVASGSTISYTNGSDSAGHEFKFATNASGEISGKTFSGYTYEGQPAGGPVLIVESGGSTVSGSADDPNYSVNWSTSLLGVGSTDAGTYDPWFVKASDLEKLGVVPGGTANLYFQSGLSAASITGLGSYEYSLYITSGSTKTDIFDLKVRNDGTFNVELGSNPQLELYLLGANANTAVSPDTKIFAPDAALVTSTTDFSSYFASDGTLLAPLNFGIRYHDFVLPVGTSPSTTLFAWHADTLVAVNHSALSVVPAPAAGLAFVVGLARKRKKLARA